MPLVVVLIRISDRLNSGVEYQKATFFSQRMWLLFLCFNLLHIFLDKMLFVGIPVLFINSVFIAVKIKLIHSECY